MQYYAIIVGGGAGTRMQQNIPKQFLLLNHKPILMHTISAFYQSSPKPEIIVVLNVAHHEYWQELCTVHNFTIPHQLVEGGETRFHSVRNGLMVIKADGLVAVHDAVRPLVSKALIDYCFEKALVNGNAIPAHQPSDSIRAITDNSSKILDRDRIVLIQTPQTFHISQLRKGYQQHFGPTFTDDASVVEQAGFKVNLVTGERTNFKITYPEDLDLANFYLHKKASMD